MVLEKWTGDVVGKMHRYGITLNDLAEEMGVSRQYVSGILHQHFKPANAKEMIETALLNRISQIEER